MTSLHTNDLAVIRYHTWWPNVHDPYYSANITENRARTNYYGADYVPHFRIDGIVDGQDSSSRWDSYLTSRAAVPSPLSITVVGTYDTLSRYGTVLATLTNTGTGPVSGKLQFAITQSGIVYGVEPQNQTMRDMLPDADGETISLAAPGDTLTRSRPYTLGPSWTADSCNVVVFLQDSTTKEVYQAASIPIMEFVGLSEGPLTPGPWSPNAIFLSSSPNPFSDEAELRFSPGVARGPGQVLVQVFNLSGQCVRTLVDRIQGPGVYVSRWDGRDDSGRRVTAGIYFGRLTVDTSSRMRKMLLLR